MKTTTPASAAELRRRRGSSFQARGLGGAPGSVVPAQKNPRQCGVLHVVNATSAPASALGRWEVRMRSISSFVIVAGLILAATGIGVCCI